MDIYVGNLPFSTQEQELIDLFSAHGVVDRVKMITDRETGRPRGFAFVTMTDDAAAEAAINALNGHDFGGRELRVRAAEDRRQGGGGFGGGGGGGGGGFGGPRRGGGGGGGGGGYGGERRGGGGGGFKGDRRGGGGGGGPRRDRY
jgi:RNA recognition motif-containing protein